MNIIVTGATGFLGMHLCAHLRAQGHAVTALNSHNANLCDQRSLLPFADTPFDLIYHLAAWTQAGDFCVHHPGEQWLINQQINTHVLQWWKEHQPQAKIVSIGTSCSYAPDRDLTEANYMHGEPIDSLYTYALTKRMTYAGLLALQRQFGLRYLCLVPSTLYGTGYHTSGKQMHFIFDLIRKIVEAKSDGTQPVLWGDGFQKRELIHVRDFVQVMTGLAGRVDNDLVNVGGGQEYTIRSFAEIICRIVGYDPELIRYDTSRYVGARSKFLRIDKLRQLLPDHRFIPLEEGLRETVQAFAREHRPQLVLP